MNPTHPTFTCSVCGATGSYAAAQAHRELMACAACGANARFRAIACAFHQGATGRSGRLDTMPARKELRGIGISDSQVYADVLSAKTSYTNTYFHTEPLLNIEDRAGFGRYGRLDFIICSDVIEHTLKPVGFVIDNLFDALAPGGFLVLSAPTYEMDTTVERYPSLQGFEVRPTGDSFIVDYATAFGTTGRDLAPIFHGGPGQVLEMRALGHAALLRELRAAGFRVEPLDEAHLRACGAAWPSMVERRDIPFPMNGGVLLARKP